MTEYTNIALRLLLKMVVSVRKFARSSVYPYVRMSTLIHESNRLQLKIEKPNLKQIWREELSGY